MTGLKLANNFNDCLSFTITSAADSPAAPNKHASDALTSSRVSSGSATPVSSRQSSPALAYVKLKSISKASRILIAASITSFPIPSPGITVISYILSLI